MTNNKRKRVANGDDLDLGERKKRSRAEFLASNLPQLQNMIRRDSASYKEEFLQQWRHWEAGRALLLLRPAAASTSGISKDKTASELSDLITFLAHV